MNFVEVNGTTRCARHPVRTPGIMARAIYYFFHGMGQ